MRRIPAVFVTTLASMVCAAFTAHAAKALSPANLEVLAGMPGYYTIATPDQVRARIAGASLKNAALEMTEGAITPLMRAASETPYPEVIRILIKAGSDINAVSMPEMEKVVASTPLRKTALNFAVENPNPAVLEALLAHKPKLHLLENARHTRSPLYDAVIEKDRGNHFILLLQAGARPFERERQHGSIWYFLAQGTVWKDSEKIPAPRVDAETAVAMTAALLEAGVQPDCGALTQALESGQSEAALMLLKAGVDPACGGPGRVLYQALHRREKKHAIPDPTPELIRELLAHNDVNAVPSWGENRAETPANPLNAPFAQACQAAMDVNVARTLKEAGAVIDTSRNDILIRALEAERDNPELVAYLLSLGFSPTREDDNGTSPMDASMRRPYKPGALPLLVRAGAPLPEWEEGREWYGDVLVQSGLYTPEGRPLITPGFNPEDAAFYAAHAQKIIKDAKAMPEEALYSDMFYRVATADEVKAVIGGRSLRGIRTTRERYRLTPDYGPGGMVGNWFAAVTGDDRTRTRTVQDTPFTHAARVTPYPEVIDALVAAGCSVKALNSQALSQAVMNDNPCVMERVLRYKPDLEAPMYDNGTPLHYLAWSGSNEHLEILLAAKPDLNVRDGEDRTPLMRAVWWKRADRVRMLIKAGADVNAVTRHGYTALYYALDRGQPDMARELIAAGSRLTAGEGRESALSEAVDFETYDRDLLLVLLKAEGSASETAMYAMERAAFLGNLEAYSLLREQGVPFRRDKMAGSLGELIYSNRRQKNDGAMVARLLADGVDPNGTMRQGLRYLTFAIDFLQPDTCAALVKGGADVNRSGEDGFTPLLFAVFSHYLDNEDTGQRRAAIVDVLIKGGADVNAETKEGWSVMLLGMNKPAVFPLLVRAGLSVNKRAGCGWTPLCYAAADQLYNGAVPALLAAGADVRGKSSSGKTPEDFARKEKNGRVMAMLEQAAAKAKSK